jgi:hypothetical protein
MLDMGFMSVPHIHSMTSIRCPRPEERDGVGKRNYSY